MEKQRFDYIDSLRGLAIIGVIITHAGSLSHLSGHLRSLTNIGGMGVQLFFMISAFTIFYSLSRAVNNPFQIRDFFIKRLFRILPVYWLGIILYTLIYGFGSRGWREAPELWHYPMHFFLLNVLYPTTSSSVVPGGWSISCEVLFYMSVPVLYKLITNKYRLLIFIIITVIIYPILNKALADFFNPLVFSEIDNISVKEFWYRWLPNQLGCFGFGILLFNLLKHKIKFIFLNNKGLNLALVFLVVLAIIFPKHFIPSMLSQNIYGFLFMCLALLLSFVQWKLFVNNIIVFMGKISFSCYLIHFIVLQKSSVFITMNYENISASHTLSFIVLFLSGIILTVPLAYLSYKFIELPAVNSGKKLIGHLNKKNVLVEDLA